MQLSLTELRQRLFELADQVIDSGVPLEIERRGVRLRLVRVDTEQAAGRLARLQPRSLVLGAPLDPHESPAEWRALAPPSIAEPAVPYRKGKRGGRTRRGP